MPNEYFGIVYLNVGDANFASPTENILIKGKVRSGNSIKTALIFYIANINLTKMIEETERKILNIIKK